jgi:hypothetical protein
VRPNNIRAFIAGILVGTAITTGTIIVAAPAKADVDAQAWAAEYGPAVCDLLSQHPTMAGLMTVLEDVVAAGYSPEESGELVAESVFDVCPRYIPILRQFVATFGPRQVA